MRGIKTGIVSILTVGLLAGSTVGVSAEDPATGSPQGEPGLDVRELEWRPLELDEATFGPGARLVDITASDSMLVIGGSVDGSAAIWTSTDGLDWERVPHDDEVFGGPADQEIKAIVPWRDGFVAAGEVNPGSDFHPQRVAAVWISMDGKDWARVPHDEKVFGGKGRQEMFDIAASDDRLVIVGFDEEGPAAGGSDDIAVWTSDDGSEWTQQTFGGGEMLAVAGTIEGFVGVGHRGLWTSPDGLQWERKEPGGLQHATLLAVAPAPGGFVAVGLDAPPRERPGTWTTPDGADWTSAGITAPSIDDEFWVPQDVALARSGLALVAGPNPYGDGTSTILVSEDGRSWVPGDTTAPVSDARLRKIASLGDHFVAIGSAQNPWESGQAGIWTTLASELNPETDGPAESEPVERDTATTLDLLPGVNLVTEEVEPGLYRVTSDGVRDLVRLADEKKGYYGGILDGNVVAGLDGSVWWFDRDGFFRLGEEAGHRWPKGLNENSRPGTDDIEVGPDGTLWLTGWFGKDARHDISSYDGQAWSNRWRGAHGERWASGVEVQQDGTVSMAWWAPKGDDHTGRVRAARLGDDGWEVLPGSVKTEGWPQGFMVAGAGGSDVWLNWAPVLARLHRHDGEGWVVQETPDLGGVMRATAGADGTLWVRLNAECDPGKGTWCSGTSDILARSDGGDWAVYDSSHGIPMMGDHYQGFEGFFEVAPDRSIWFNPIGDFERTGSECDGIINFDGEAITHFLRDTCVYAMDLAPDGTVWLQAGEYRADVASGQHLGNVQPGPIHTYVITPEAVAE